MIKGSTERLMELSKTMLRCSLDDNPPDHIPSDLNPGSYRWFLYMYSNMYSPEDKIIRADKPIFISIFNILYDHHTISWTRDTLIALDRNKLPDLTKQVLRNIKNTDNFYELKVNLYLYRCLKVGWAYADPFILEHSPSLRNFV